MAAGGQPFYIIVLLVAVSLLVLAVFIFVVYLCCNRRYKLNWYERSLLESERTEISSGTTSRLVCSEPDAIDAFGSKWAGAGYHRSSTSGAIIVPQTTVEYVNIRNNNNMGSYPTSPLTSEPALSGSDWGAPEAPDHSASAGADGTKFAFPLAPSGSTLSPYWRHATETPDSPGLYASGIQSGSDDKRDSQVSRREQQSIVPNLRRFSAGATPTGDHVTAKSSGAAIGAFPVPDSNNYGAIHGKKKRSNSLISQLATPITNYLKSGTSSRDSSTSSLQELSPPAQDIVTAVPVAASRQYRRRRASMQDALDHTKINASLYQFDRPELCKQESVASIPEDSQLGSIHFSLTYDPEQSLLTVRLIQASNLVPRDFSGKMDPYCRLRLLPNQKLQLQSKVQRKTRCPEFEEEFIFDVPQSDVGSRTLEIQVFDFDQYSRDECIGQVHFALEHVELSRDPVLVCRAILPYDDQKQIRQSDRGELMFSLAYLPSAERLTVAIMKARNLKADDVKGNTSKTLSPFVRVTIVSDGKKLKKKKTSTKRGTNNPIWNEAVVFNVTKPAIRNLQTELAVYHENLLGNSEFLGKVIIGPNSSEEELSHWNDVINSKSALARWHHLAAEDS